MPVATTTEAGREVLTPAAKAIMDNAASGRATVAHADRARRQAEARARSQAAADALNGRRADTLTPLDTLGRAPLDTIPEPPAAAPAPAKMARSFHFSTEIAYKGRVITVHAEGMTLSEFSALLDAHGFVAAEVAS